MLGGVCKWCGAHLLIYVRAGGRWRTDPGGFESAQKRLAVAAQAADKKPNIIDIFRDDIGIWNVGAYTHGMMGKTPNIERIATEGMRFTDHYGQPSCTAGRAAFITGQLPIRTGMTTIGIPGSTRGSSN